MAEKSKIEWTDSTFNPWIGCTKISPACDNCYAESWSKRFGDVEWGNHERRRTSEKTWNNPRRWQRDADAWKSEHGRPRFVFCASLADVFDNQVPADWRADLWKLIKECDRLVWLLLTKRPQNIAKMLPDDWGAGYPNVWLGTTVENQEIANRNIPHLFNVSAAKRFLSIEPIVGPIDLTVIDIDGDSTMDALTAPTWEQMESEWHGTADDWKDSFEDFYGVWPGDRSGPMYRPLDWVITGGESGTNARPAHPDWYRDLRDQCVQASVPFHFKQWGEWKPLEDSSEGEWPTKTDHMCRFSYDGEYVDHGYPQQRVGKKFAGRLLDGRTWDERPNP